MCWLTAGILACFTSTDHNLTPSIFPTITVPVMWEANKSALLQSHGRNTSITYYWAVKDLAEIQLKPYSEVPQQRKIGLSPLLIVKRKERTIQRFHLPKTFLLRKESELQFFRRHTQQKSVDRSSCSPSINKKNWFKSQVSICLEIRPPTTFLKWRLDLCSKLDPVFGDQKSNKREQI